MANAESSVVFKLFGKTIQTNGNQSSSSSSLSSSDEDKTADAASARAETLLETLPCPRCKSKETKFCYFNNYNVNQPRHFCRACHRYWTAGGTLRNVPVGAGRRRSRAPPASSTAPAGVDGVNMHGAVDRVVRVHARTLTSER